MENLFFEEFILIYILLLIVIITSIVNLVFTIKSGSIGKNKNHPVIYNSSKQTKCFCRNCANEYDANLSKCPHCGAKKIY